MPDGGGFRGFTGTLRREDHHVEDSLRNPPLSTRFFVPAKKGGMKKAATGNNRLRSELCCDTAEKTPSRGTNTHNLAKGCAFRTKEVPQAHIQSFRTLIVSKNQNENSMPQPAPVRFFVHQATFPWGGLSLAVGCGISVH